MPQRRRRGATALALAVLASGCADGRHPLLTPNVVPPAPADLSAFVTGEAAQHLGVDGRFVLPPATGPASAPIISRERAAELALGFIKTWGSSFETSWEKQRGAPIELDCLTLDPRVYHAETPYGVLPSSAHPGERKGYGPYYLVWFTSGEEPAVLIAVSAYNPDLAVGADGRVRLPLRYGNDFLPLGVAPNGRRPISPEQAVVSAASATGARVTSIPQLVKRPRPWHPNAARWRVTLDRAVNLRGNDTGARYTTWEVYVDGEGTLSVATPDQPTHLAEKLLSRAPDPGNPRAHWELVHLPIRAGIPVQFEDVSAI